MLAWFLLSKKQEAELLIWFTDSYSSSGLNKDFHALGKVDIFLWPDGPNFRGRDGDCNTQFGGLCITSVHQSSTILREVGLFPVATSVREHTNVQGRGFKQLCEVPENYNRILWDSRCDLHNHPTPTHHFPYPSTEQWKSHTFPVQKTWVGTSAYGVHRLHDLEPVATSVSPLPTLEGWVKSSQGPCTQEHGDAAIH